MASAVRALSPVIMDDLEPLRVQRRDGRGVVPA